MQIRGRYKIYFFHVCEHKEEDKEIKLTKLELISGQTSASQAPGEDLVDSIFGRHIYHLEISCN